ncbi:hypothetical protein C8J56DRAFT_895409 [Mycena floridula]|nr:hypothetical protein C8J56DRAFT_895409 [Mycena floridula]
MEYRRPFPSIDVETLQSPGTIPLGKKLLPLVKRAAKSSPGVRIVNVSSIGHSYAPPGTRFRSVEDFNLILGDTDDYVSNVNRYGLENSQIFCSQKSWAANFELKGLMHWPSLLIRGSWRHNLHWKGRCLGPGIIALDGALRAMFSATDPIVWKKRTITKPSENAQNAELAHEFWDTSEFTIANSLSL